MTSTERREGGEVGEVVGTATVSLQTAAVSVQQPESQFKSFWGYINERKSTIHKDTKEYFKSLLPVVGWLPRYNLTWFYGDLIAGFTVGLLVIPQAISYATKLANLPAQFGLYTAFIGVLIYTFFATSKDVTVGPTAVLSLLVGQTLANYDAGDSQTGQVIFAITLAFLVGLFQMALGLLRLGIIIDFVPVSVIAGFTTGAAFQIIIGQLPGLLGIKGVDNTQPPYLVLSSWFGKLNTIANSKYDVAFGLSAFVFILVIKYLARFLGKRHPAIKYFGLARNGFAIIFFTGLSFAVRNSATLSIVGNIPKGLSGIKQPNLNTNFLSAVIRAVPGVLIVSVLEHVAVTKSYGRVNGYRANDNQELFALGLINTFGSFVGAFPVTGSFSRSAILSQSGVRSPLAALFGGVVLIIALFTLTGVFYWIPSAVLSAIIICAVPDLFATPKAVAHIFHTSFLDFVSFVIALVVTFFSSIENAIYASVGFSLLVLLIRVARPKARILSRTTAAGWIDAEGEGYSAADPSVTSSPQGIIVYRPYEALTYPNASFLNNSFKSEILERFKYSGPHIPPSQRSWDDDTEERAARRRQQASADSDHDLPVLRAVVFDFSAVNGIDYTGLQTLLDVKEDLSRFAGHNVPFHFAHVRRDHLRILWEVPTKRSVTLDAYSGTAASVAAAAAAASAGAGAASSEEDGETPEVDVGGGVYPENEKRLDAGLYFHLTVDEAVTAADFETAHLLATPKPGFLPSPASDYTL